MSSNQKVDLRGLTCPEPVIRTKKLFDNPDIQSVEALVDDDVCVNNLQRLARSLKAGCNVKNNNGYFTITLDKRAQSEPAQQDVVQSEGVQPAAGKDRHVHPTPVAGKEATPSSSTGTVIFIGKDQFGQGDEEFSRTLMNLFLQTLFDSGLRPRAILMANTGVRLMAKNSQALKVLQDFQQAGCEVLVCGLCVDYYKIKDDVPKDRITNMFAICEYLFAADKVIQP